jgi:hypothetical protein
MVCSPTAARARAGRQSVAAAALKQGRARAAMVQTGGSGPRAGARASGDGTRSAAALLQEPPRRKAEAIVATEAEPEARATAAGLRFRRSLLC